VWRLSRYLTTAAARARPATEDGANSPRDRIRPRVRAEAGHRIGDDPAAGRRGCRTSAMPGREAPAVGAGCGSLGDPAGVTPACRRPTPPPHTRSRGRHQCRCRSASNAVIAPVPKLPVRVAAPGQLGSCAHDRLGWLLRRRCGRPLRDRPDDCSRGMRSSRRRRRSAEPGRCLWANARVSRAGRLTGSCLCNASHAPARATPGSAGVAGVGSSAGERAGPVPTRYWPLVGSRPVPTTTAACRLSFASASESQTTALAQISGSPQLR